MIGRIDSGHWSGGVLFSDRLNDMVVNSSLFEGEQKTIEQSDSLSSY